MKQLENTIFSGKYPEIAKNIAEIRGDLSKSIYRNGSEIKVSKFRNGASGERYLRYVSLSASAMFTLSAGDTIELYCQSLDNSGNDARVLANAFLCKTFIVANSASPPTILCTSFINSPC